jgi:FMN reductase
MFPAPPGRAAAEASSQERGRSAAEHVGFGPLRLPYAPAMTALGVVVGNPKPRSRTLEVARHVARAAATAAGVDPDDEVVVDLAELGPQLFDWASRDVAAVIEEVSACTLLVVASPTYKASYTGLLKSFLDWFGTTGLAGVTTVPVMVGAGERHALAVEVHLRPVLVEIGASLPTRGLYVVESDLDRLDTVVADWSHAAAPALRRAVG